MYGYAGLRAVLSDGFSVDSFLFPPLCTLVLTLVLFSSDVVVGVVFFCRQALHAPIGQSDGLVYKHLFGAVTSAPGALSRPPWWREYLGQRKGSE